MVDKLFFLCMAVALATGSMAFAHDVKIPDWRGDSGTTYQLWEFGTDDLFPAPEVGSYNPYGETMLSVTPLGEWIPDPGAWTLTGEINILIPNLQETQREKHIWIQLTWQEADNDPFFLPPEPLISIASYPAFAGMSMSPRFDDVTVAPGWIHSIIDIVIWPNPFWEWITIRGDILVDQLVIDTMCIPEPATIFLLGLGTLILFKIRRA